MNLLTDYVPKSAFDGVYESLLLQEGLIASYDIDLLSKKIQQVLKDRLIKIAYKNLSDVFGSTSYGKPFTLTIEVISWNPNEITTLLNTFGYFISEEYTEGESSIVIIEPKVPVKINPFLKEKKLSKAYHITPKIHLEKIFQIGLVTKLSKTSFAHTGSRIYLAIPARKEFLKPMVNMLAKDRGDSMEDYAVLEVSLNWNQPYFLDDNATTLMQRFVAILAFFTPIPISPVNFSVLSD